MKIILLLLITLLTQITYAQNWSQLEDFSGDERDDGTVFMIDNFAYCGTGMVPWFVAFGDFHKYDLANDSWSTITSLPASEERQYACGFSHNAKGFVFGGINGSTYLNDLWEYIPSNDSWSQKSSLPSNGVSGASSFIIADTAYIIGGKDINGIPLSSVWAYDFTNDSWTQKNDLPHENWRGSAVVHSNVGYLLFGKDASNQSNDKLYRYDPSTDSWAQLSTFPNDGRYYATMQSINNFLITGFGIDDLGNYYNGLWSFDLTTNSWNELPSNGISERKGGMCFTHNETIYYTTGITSTNERQKDTWKYTPVLGLPSLQQTNINVYPNPAQNELKIEASEMIQHIEIKTLLGEIVYSTSDVATINTSSLSNGIYLLIIHSQKESFAQRIEIMR